MRKGKSKRVDRCKVEAEAFESLPFETPRWAVTEITDMNRENQFHRPQLILIRSVSCMTSREITQRACRHQTGIRAMLH
jgi:hypothetical protein